MDPRQLLPDGADDSTLDVLDVLQDVLHPPSDLLLLSKGHNPLALYAVLAARGRIDPALLDDYGAYESPLGHHPDRCRLPVVSISSGSLGHGLPIAVGAALGLRAQHRTGRVVCVLGDGELDEGSNAEAIQYAGRVALGSLTAVVIDNGSATHGWPGGIGRRFAVEGWRTATVDAHDRTLLARALARDFGAATPLALVAAA